MRRSPISSMPRAAAKVEQVADVAEVGAAGVDRATSLGAEVARVGVEQLGSAVRARRARASTTSVTPAPSQSARRMASRVNRRPSTTPSASPRHRLSRAHGTRVGLEWRAPSGGWRSPTSPGWGRLRHVPADSVTRPSRSRRPSAARTMSGACATWRTTASRVKPNGRARPRGPTRRGAAGRPPGRTGPRAGSHASSPRSPTRSMTSSALVTSTARPSRISWWHPAEVIDVVGSGHGSDVAAGIDGVLDGVARPGAQVGLDDDRAARHARDQPVACEEP